MDRHSIPRATESYPLAIDHSFYEHELPEASELYKHQIADGDDIFARLDEEIDFYSRSSAEDYEARYFDVEDLYGRADDEYDYPRGIEDDDDSYSPDPDLRAIFEEGMLFGRDHREYPNAKELEDEEDLRAQMVLEDEIVDAQYFDATDLYDRGDMQCGEEYEVDSDTSDDSRERGPQELVVGKLLSSKADLHERDLSAGIEQKHGRRFEARSDDNSDSRSSHGERRYLEGPELEQELDAHSPDNAWPWTLPSPAGRSFLVKEQDRWYNVPFARVSPFVSFSRV